MSDLHTFNRPAPSQDPRQVGAAWSDRHVRYDEGARFIYRDGAYELALFWPGVAAGEARGFGLQAVELALYEDAPCAFLLYRIDQVCEWSDVAFNYLRMPEIERELPAEPPGERARLLMFLVDSDTGFIRARRFAALDKVLSQALRHTLHQQSLNACDPDQYQAALARTHARFPDSDALLRAADIQEYALG